MPLADDIDALARALPKVLLHDHLDGGLRPATLLEGEECGDWFGLRGAGGGLAFSCRDAARQRRSAAAGQQFEPLEFFGREYAIGRVRLRGIQADAPDMHCGRFRHHILT